MRPLKVLYEARGTAELNSALTPVHRARCSARNAKGDHAELKFTGTGIDCIAEKFSEQGSIDIYLDGFFRRKRL